MANIASDDTLFDHGIAAGNELRVRARSTGVPDLGLVKAFKALTERVLLAQQRRDDAAVGRFIEEHGGQLTDDLERQISRRFGNNAGNW